MAKSQAEQLERLDEANKIRVLRDQRHTLELRKEQRKAAALERLHQMDLQRVEQHEKWKKEQEQATKLKRNVPLFKKIEDKFQHDQQRKEKKV